MKITSIDSQKFQDYQVVTARIDKLTLWFRFPIEIDVDIKDATPFVLAAHAPAMLFGEDIYVSDEYTVSPRLAENLKHIQSIYETWNPIFKPVNLIAQQAEPAAKKSKSCSFFSGGVDGTYTLLKYSENIDKLILINGFDFNIDNETWSRMVNKNRSFLEKLGKDLIPLETNHRSFLAAFGLSGYSNFGSTLSSIGQLLGFSSVYISGSDTYSYLLPVGAHPLVDPYCSTEKTRVIHTGLEADRAGKIQAIKSNRSALDNLWVCSNSPGINCGQCSKCIRTFISLVLNDVNDFHFAHPVSVRDIKKLKISIDDELTFMEMFLSSAEEKGLESVRKELRRKVLGYKLKRLLQEIEEYYLPSVRAWRIKRRPAGDEHVLISILPRYSDRTALEHARQKLHDSEFEQEVPDIGSVYEKGRAV